jgi:hypothetical protein
MSKFFNQFFFCVGFLFLGLHSSFAQNETTNQKFSQLDQELPTPNSYRTASGAPGHEYWQQQADYKIKVELNDEKQQIFGEETVTFTNNSPDELSYLWLQLDQNIYDKNSDTKKVKTGTIGEKMSIGDLAFATGESDFDGGFRLDYIQDMTGKALPYVVNKTMLRIDLPTPLKGKGAKFSFKVKYWFNINDRFKVGGRSGYEYFKEEDNYLYTIAQFFPRMCNYLDNQGWQNKQFLGAGEFTLPFGNYEVSITVPDDHLVAATGMLQNLDILTAEQRQRFEEGKKSYTQPVIVATEKEAREREKTKSKGKKTWIFKAENVRDFGFATSRKFIWDVMAVPQSSGKVALAMSMYPKEGNPLWEKYSTKAVAHTLKWYSHYTIDYPYPCAWSINADRIGMEYPMICYNFGRCEKDGSYSDRTKYGMLSVIFHEVGHNYFPMIINSDERQWTWMDEGLNTFVQYLAEQQWERDYPSGRGPAYKMVDYMKGDKAKLEPIMTNSESLQQFGNNAYGKPATALNILRETVMGRELFDHAFKTYANRWKFKHPSPADFFRTMEDASAVDLDWFWRGWFYTTDNVDLAINNVKWYHINTKNPDIEKVAKKAEKEKAPKFLGDIRNATEIEKTYEELDPSLKDFYSDFDPLQVTSMDREEYTKYVGSIGDDEKKLIASGKNYYEIAFERIGGLPSPIILKMDFVDGTSETQKIPAEIWRFNQSKVNKIFATEKEVKQFTLDPNLETADIDTKNNSYPPVQQLSRFEIFKQKEGGGENDMQKAKKAKEKGGQ